MPFSVSFFLHCSSLPFYHCILTSTLEHKDLYMAGVLHGDVSLGNLVLCPIYDENTKSYTWDKPQGKLIDLDHAKYTRSRVSVEINADSSKDTSDLQYILRALNYGKSKESLDLAHCARRALEMTWTPDSGDRVRDALKYAQAFAVLDQTVLNMKVCTEKSSQWESQTLTLLCSSNLVKGPIFQPSLRRKQTPTL